MYPKMPLFEPGVSLAPLRDARTAWFGRHGDPATPWRVHLPHDCGNFVRKDMEVI
jgi:hypothetical protein